jgi:hypothetical protein
MAFVGLLWYGSFYLIKRHFPLSWSERGQFGDLFGAVNALFSGLAFAGIIFTIYIQQKEIEQNSKDLKRQQFGGTFFNMLNMLNQIVINTQGEIFISSPMVGKTKAFKGGREYISVALIELVEDGTFFYKFDKGKFVEYGGAAKIMNHTDDPTGKAYTEKEMKEIINDRFKEFYKNKSSALAHYFRYVYNIIKYTVTNNFLTEDDKKFYISLLQTQLSNDELGLIFYDALSDFGLNKNKEDLFRQWLDKYSVLENIDPSNLMCESHIHLYPLTKFKLETLRSL